jgi:uncharacterized protein with ATP-grasp and redox domains
MKTYFDCISCFVQQTISTLRRISDDEALQEEALRKVLLLLSEINLNVPPPVMAQPIYRTIREVTGNADPFSQEKTNQNIYAHSLVPEIKERYHNDPDLFIKMLRLSIAGNSIDSGVNSAVKSEDVLKSIHCSMETPIDMKAVNALRNAITEANTILYLGDNAGEIVFDKLLIEQMPHDKVTYVVRGAPIINDVTIKDAQQVKMDELVAVIDNGSDAPGTILDDCAQGFRERFWSADLIIAKGQGNYETLSGVDKNIFFLLQAKCPVIARDIGCEVGSFIVKSKF